MSAFEQNESLGVAYSVSSITPVRPDGNLEMMHAYMENVTDISFLNGNKSDIRSQQTMVYYTILFKIISVTINLIIFIVGFIGNILVVVVVCRTKSMHTPTNCYLISLSVADCLVLVSATLPAVPEPFYQVDEWPWGRAMCSILVFLQYLGVDASSLSITAFTVERYIAICHPMKAQRMCTVKRATRIIMGIWIFTILYCAPWLGLTTVIRRSPTREACTFRLKREQYQYYYMTDLIAFYVVPLLIAALLYALIAKILFSTNISKTSGGKYKENGQCRIKKSTSSRKQVVRMLIVIVGVFATLWLPYRAMVVYNSFSSKKYHDMWFLLFCRVMIYINSAINPILYNAMSVKFRRAFQKVLCCGIQSVKQQQTEVYSDVTIYEKTTINLRSTLGSSSRENSYLMLPRKSMSRSLDNLGRCSPDHVNL